MFPLLTLTYFMLLVSLYTPWKYQKIFGFRMFSVGIGRDQWHEMGEIGVCLQRNFVFRSRRQIVLLIFISLRSSENQ